MFTETIPACFAVSFFNSPTPPPSHTRPSSSNRLLRVSLSFCDLHKPTHKHKFAIERPLLHIERRMTVKELGDARV
ncbi:hypothetical protein L1987_02615 [Smallanthus sonchifolius]|uniref:Uncharacterized protein n=1 Tax=Smallanthus sonchifolius TaxID=185202 RepID=A0ACB9K8F5_9ASTR|nr:hypothetical protein L1987_02615 [Smallanthus sonchifolius]